MQQREGARRVALVAATQIGYTQAVLRGVAAYARPARPWVFRMIPPEQVGAELLLGWAADGVLSCAVDEHVGEQIQASGLPWVTTVFLNRYPDTLCVGNDDPEIGRLAAEHLLARGFRNLAYAGDPGGRLRPRANGFIEAARLARAEVQFCYSPLPENKAPQPPANAGTDREARLGDWLAGLPLPAGVMAENDHVGWELVQTCALVGRRVPDEIAVVGVDDMDPLCRLCSPSLSSIAVAGEQIGYQAASQLDALMAGQELVERRVSFPPLGVVTRQSTDVLAVADAVVAEAVRFIRAHISEQLEVGRVARHVGVHRRALERRFRLALQRSPLEEIRRFRVERAKELLVWTDLPVSEVAERSGCGDAKQLAVHFRQLAGESPSGFRKRRWRPAGFALRPFSRGAADCGGVVTNVPFTQDICFGWTADSPG